MVRLLALGIFNFAFEAFTTANANSASTVIGTNPANLDSGDIVYYYM